MRDAVQLDAMNPWQRATIQAAASYLRERIAQGATDARTKALYEGLLEVLDPARRSVRLQRELAGAAKAAVTVQTARERRTTADRRRHEDRRKVSLGRPDGIERRRSDRRADRTRRAHG
jgi:hypothetical protein